MALSLYLRKRIARANRAVSMAQLMQRLGYLVTQADAEQQFACDLHGRDEKPSARLYPRTNSTYCWACHKPRRPVDLLQEKENLSLEETVSALESMFNLPSLPLVEETELEFPELEPEASLEAEAHRTERLLLTLTWERTLAQDRTLWAWEKFDQARYLVEKEQIPKETAIAVFAGLRERLLQEVRAE